MFPESRLLADDSHEISYLIFSKIRKDVAKVSSAAAVTGALRVNVMVLWDLSFGICRMKFFYMNQFMRFVCSKTSFE